LNDLIILIIVTQTVTIVNFEGDFYSERLAQRQFKAARFCESKTSAALNCPLELFVICIYCTFLSTKLFS